MKEKFLNGTLGLVATSEKECDVLLEYLRYLNLINDESLYNIKYHFLTVFRGKMGVKWSNSLNRIKLSLLSRLCDSYFYAMSTYTFLNQIDDNEFNKYLVQRIFEKELDSEKYQVVLTRKQLKELKLWDDPKIEKIKK